MAGANGAAMAIAVCKAGGLGSLPCAMLTPEEMRAEIALIKQQTARPFNLNFFCHRRPEADPAKEAAWKERLACYYAEFGLDPAAEVPTVNRLPFDDSACELVEELRPAVVSFHFGLPSPELLKRVKASGCRILSSATTVAEARWLEARGVDAIIAQGVEAGGHRGMFLDDNIEGQAGLFALLPQVVDAVNVPVIAAGGIGDARGIAAALILGASAVQIGTAYLFTEEATISSLHLAAISEIGEDDTALTNLFSGRPARGLINRVMREVGPISAMVPAFPTAGRALAPLKAAAEAVGSGDFSSLWVGQAASLSHGVSRGTSAKALTENLAAQAKELLQATGSFKEGALVN